MCCQGYARVFASGPCTCLAHLLVLPALTRASCRCRPLFSLALYYCTSGVPYELLNREFAFDTAYTLCMCRYLIYVGECRGGVNGTDEFFDALKKVRGREGGKLKLGNGRGVTCRRVGMGLGGGCPLFNVLHIAHTGHFG